MFLPATAEDCHFQHFAGAFVNAGNFNVAFDFFYGKFFGVTKAAHGLDGIFGRFVARFRGLQLGDSAFRGEAVVIDFQLFGRPVNISTRGFKTDIVRGNEF